MTIFVRRTIIVESLSRCVMIRCVAHRRQTALARFWNLVQAHHARFERLNFDQRAEERQRRLRTLVQVHTVDVQAVATTARVWIVDAGVEIVVAQEPAKRAARLDHPKAVSRDLVGLTTSGDGSVRLQRLLVEASTRLTLTIETVRTNGSEVTALSALLFDQPAQRFQADLARSSHFRVFAGGGDHGLRQA